MLFNIQYTMDDIIEDIQGSQDSLLVGMIIEENDNLTNDDFQAVLDTLKFALIRTDDGY